jgi:drug/metabolite transporter (DMT)-like permease
VFYGVLLFGERLSWMTIAGMLLIVGLACTVLACVPSAANTSSEG